jgi:hypothetical protein
MNAKLLLSLIFVFVVSLSFGQKSTKSFYLPTNIGIQFIQGNENSFLFNDPDYFYLTNTLKLELYYPLTKWKKYDISLIIQPQTQLIKHQLYNEQFVRPDIKDYLEKRARFTKLKSISITAIEFTIDVKRQLLKHTAVFIQFGLGFAIVDTSTERLAKGFTFIENINTGLEFLINKKISMRLFGGIGHVSNLNFQKPNAGYNLFNTGISIQYSLK